MKRKRQYYIFLLIIAVLSVALIGLAAFSVIIQLKQKENVAAFSTLKENTENTTETLSKKIASLEEEKAKLENELNDVINEKNDLIRSFSDADSLYRELNEKFEALRSEIAQREAVINELRENIKKLENVYMVDINAQFDILNELLEVLAVPPMIEVKTEKENEDGTITEEITYEAPKIGLYYEDINNGYKYAFNADEVLNPASMIKAPYVLSLLTEASAEESKIEEARLAAKEAGALETFVEPERKFDMKKKIIYTKDAYFQPGSGNIVKSEDGTEYTYLDLFFHVLDSSDNVAYAILKQTFGNSYYSNLVVKLNAVSMYKKPVGMSASDAGKCMKAIYEFIESDAFYAPFMKDAMIKSAHLVLIPYSVAPKKTAHKYGWDIGSYCDMGIVYAENPYVLAILTNYEKGGKEVNEYLQSVLKLINKMHDNFYIQR